MATNTPSVSDLLAALAKLQAENIELKKSKTSARPISMKVSEKGALSVYGMGRFPVTLYREQWERLLEESQVGAIKAFITEHKAEFSSKADGLKVSTAATSATGDSATAPKVKPTALKIDMTTGKAVLPSGNAF